MSGCTNYTITTPINFRAIFVSGDEDHSGEDSGAAGEDGAEDSGEDGAAGAEGSGWWWSDIGGVIQILKRPDTLTQQI